MAIIIASWPLIEAWSVERGPATMDTSEICSPEALVGRGCDRPKFGILSAKTRWANPFALFFAALHLYLDAAERRLRTSSAGQPELPPAKVARVRSGATQRRR